MNPRTEEERHELLRQLLFDLAKGENALETDDERECFYRRLEEIYDHLGESDRFRHLYSNIFMWLTFIDKDEGYDIEVLAQNLNYIREKYTAVRYADTNGKPRLIDIHLEINKLFDHVNLDFARISYVKSIERSTLSQEELKEWQHRAELVEDQTRELTERAEGLNTAAENAEKAVRDAQRDSTTILGIFAAIVLAFTGGIAFSTSVLENIGAASAPRIIILSLIIGLVVINTIGILLQFIAALVRADRKHISVKWINIILIVLLCGTLMLHYYFPQVLQGL